MRQCLQGSTRSSSKESGQKVVDRALAPELISVVIKRDKINDKIKRLALQSERRRLEPSVTSCVPRHRFSMTFQTSTEDAVRIFIAKHKQLLVKEREAEIARTSLLLSNCAPSLLEQKGLALGGLGVANMDIGLGGKTCVPQNIRALHVTDFDEVQSSRTGEGGI